MRNTRALITFAVAAATVAANAASFNLSTLGSYSATGVSPLAVVDKSASVANRAGAVNVTYVELSYDVPAGNGTKAVSNGWVYLTDGVDWAKFSFTGDRKLGLSGKTTGSDNLDLALVSYSGWSWLSNPGTGSLSWIEDTVKGTSNVTFQYDAVPEPATLAVLGIGALGILRRRNRK